MAAANQATDTLQRRFLAVEAMASRDGAQRVESTFVLCGKANLVF